MRASTTVLHIISIFAHLSQSDKCMWEVQKPQVSGGVWGSAPTLSLRSPQSISSPEST